MPISPALTTYAPRIDQPPNYIPTGNLWLSLPQIDRSTGAIHSLSVLHEATAGMLEAGGSGEPSRGLIEPRIEVDGQLVELQDVTWVRDGNWLPRLRASCGDGAVEMWYCAPVDERGLVLRLSYQRRSGESVVRLGWSFLWMSTLLTHLRAKPVDVAVHVEADPWTGSHVVVGEVGLPLLTLGLQPGDGLGITTISSRECELMGQWSVDEQETVVAEAFISVSCERDGAATTALHLRRRGFDELWTSTMGWLARHELPVRDHDARAGLHERVNENLFFNYFFAQGDCLDTGRPVVVTSRSPEYYVSAAFWSRDAYLWTFPAILLTDVKRARRVLLATTDAAGERAAEHALYLNGTPLYPGFELDQAAAPVLAIQAYVVSTGDWTVLAEPQIDRMLTSFEQVIGPWFNTGLGLYGTFLLPTDDPTEFRFTTTGNALVAAAFDARAQLADGPGPVVRNPHNLDRRRAADLREAIHRQLQFDTGDEPAWAWAWACDGAGQLDVRDEPPLSLRNLPYWGLCATDDAQQVGTRAWLARNNRFRYDGAYPGAGSSHFPYPSGFDLANRLLDRDDTFGDATEQLVNTPMDHGLACESWDPATGVVRTGAAMASMAGLLTWTTWARLTGRGIWHEPMRVDGHPTT